MSRSRSKLQNASVELDIRDLGLDTAAYATDELDFVVTPRPILLRNTLVERSKAWVGHDFSGQKTEQCANFVRRVLAESGICVAAAAKPFDVHLTGELAQGPDFANSFFSSENGRLLGYAELTPGDLMAFRDTYEGDFPKGCITHVGIWVGEDHMIDRSTAGEPVRRQQMDAWWKERFVVGLRPKALC